MKTPDHSPSVEGDSPLTGPVDRAQPEPTQAELSGGKQDPTRQFSAIVAHSLNNLLTSIIGYANLVQSNLPETQGNLKSVYRTHSACGGPSIEACPRPSGILAPFCGECPRPGPQRYSEDRESAPCARAQEQHRVSRAALPVPAAGLCRCCSA